MTTRARPRYTGYRFPAAIISPALWFYFRFALGLRMVEELLAARGIILSPKTVRQWAGKFGRQFANQIRRPLPRAGDKWHLDEVVLESAGVKHWLWRWRGESRGRAIRRVLPPGATPPAPRVRRPDARPSPAREEAPPRPHLHAYPRPLPGRRDR